MHIWLPCGYISGLLLSSPHWPSNKDPGEIAPLAGPLCWHLESMAYPRGAILAMSLVHDMGAVIRNIRILKGGGYSSCFPSSSFLIGDRGDVRG